MFLKNECFLNQVIQTVEGNLLMIASYLFYLGTVLFASVFAGLAQRYSHPGKEGKKVPHRFFWFISMGILIFVMGFREVGVGLDDLNYLRLYNRVVNSSNILDYYRTNVIEPGFYFLCRLVHYIFADFQWVIILTSIITIFYFYKAIEYEIENIPLGLAVFIFSTTQYFYYFGILRLGVAVSLIGFAYRYILENKNGKYIFMILLAALFHYSAAIALLLLFLNYFRGKFYKNKKSIMFQIILITLISFCMIKWCVYPFVTASRYQRYIYSSGFMSKTILNEIPLLILSWAYYNKSKTINKRYPFYFFLFFIKLVVEMLSPIVGTARFFWYFSLGLCFLLPSIVKMNENWFERFGMLILVVFYCLVYSYYAYFGNSYSGLFMLPYRNVFFKL